MGPKADRAMIMCLTEQKRQVCAIPFQAFMNKGKRAPKTTTRADEMKVIEDAAKFMIDLAKEFAQDKHRSYHPQAKPN